MLQIVDRTSPYALTGAVFAQDRKAVVEATLARVYGRSVLRVLQSESFQTVIAGFVEPGESLEQAVAAPVRVSVTPANGTTGVSVVEPIIVSAAAMSRPVVRPPARWSTTMSGFSSSVTVHMPSNA